MKKQEEKSVKESMLPKIARKVGEHTVGAACFWWANQPKVPESMKKEK